MAGTRRAYGLFDDGRHLIQMTEAGGQLRAAVHDGNFGLFAILFRDAQREARFRQTIERFGCVAGGLILVDHRLETNARRNHLARVFIETANFHFFASKVIMHEIKQLVAKESVKDILSDDAIAKALKERGMDVARRTVVKYRQILEIPSSVDRRRLKQSQG